jgi:magnesium-transporting ATPase (P-type)
MIGRNIYSNVQRFLQFQVTAAITAIVTEFLGYMWFTEPPIRAMELIWINLFVEIVSTISLTGQGPITDADCKCPFNKNTTQIMGGVIWRQILSISIWMSIVMVFLIFFGQNVYGLSYETATQITDTAGELPTTAAMAKMTHFTIIYNTYIFL